ncbi:hypothetical protein [Paenibacillus sp. B2(2019)]|uniref:hypothetical protein n=1 Tax=Paenibacillus sp. B2(2019) TaxID=2607754 RepID=UPI0011F2B175|nr:hypothetical protein [Paenibacillus sp. B2(2019)]KAA1186876.1 hypothetical protein PAENI_11210 [Paenibacillus sp. B2(2019)]
MTGQSSRSTRVRIAHTSLQCLKEERGSALVLVMFIVLILTILGLSVLSATVGGAQRTETRKNDVQSLHLAEKTLDEAVAYITSSLNKKIESNVDMSQEDLDQAIKKFLETLPTTLPDTLSAGLKASTGLANASGKINGVTYPKEATIGNGQLVRYIVTIKSEAEVNGVKRNLKQRVFIDTFPDFLKYTIGSEKNLTINGAPLIIGNIYAGDTLIISDKAEYIYRKNGGSIVSRPFELDGEAHVQSLDKLIYREAGKSDIKASDITEETSMNGKIPQDKVGIRNRRTFVEVNVEGSFVDKVAEAIGAGADRTTIRNKLAEGELASYLAGMNLYNFDAIDQVDLIKPVLMDDSPEAQEDFVEKMVEYNETVNIIKNPTKSVIYKGDLDLDGSGDFPGILYSEDDKNTTPSRKWFIVDGNLIIDNYGNEKAVQICANILVTGKVEIRGNVQIDSTMFILKEPSTINGILEHTTLVEDANLQGLGDKELVLISRGPILINRLAAFSNTPTQLDAFFYTDSEADLYGVGSMFSLSGGFFAKGNLTINAVRGTAVGKDNEIVIDNNSKLIRFKAAYNDKIFEDQKAGLPRVKTVNISVEDMQLE